MKTTFEYTFIVLLSNFTKEGNDFIQVALIGIQI